MQLHSPQCSPALLQIYRESILPDSIAPYEAIEDETAYLCSVLNCPHPHLAMQPLDNSQEVWWLNAFESDVDKERVEAAYAANGALMAALVRNSQRKAAVTGPAVDSVLRARPEISGSLLVLTGARFIVMVVDCELGDGAAYQAADGTMHWFKTCSGEKQANALDEGSSPGTRVFAIRPRWGYPAPEWIAADREFWVSNPSAQGTRP